MKREAVDFNDMRSNRYKTMRILSAPGIWSSVYQERIKKLSGYRTAILFPEMLLGLDQARIYAVCTKKTYGAALVNIQRLSPKQICILDEYDNRSTIPNRNGFLDFEQRCNDDEAYKKLFFTDTGLPVLPDLLVFGNLALFTSKADTLKFANNVLETKLGSF
jgi:hypothetical protein